MSDSSDPSRLSYPVLPTSSLDDNPSQTSLIDFQSPTLPSEVLSSGIHQVTPTLPSDVFAGGNRHVTPSLPSEMFSRGTQHVTPTPPSEMFSGRGHQVTPTLSTGNSLHSQHSALHTIRNTPSQGSRMSTDPQALRLQHLEQLCSKLYREKSEAQIDFDRQRKKFMDKLNEVESERMLLANTIARYGTEMREISTQLLSKDEELNNVRLAAKMSEKQMREDFDRDRVIYEEEIASLGHIMACEWTCVGCGVFVCVCWGDRGSVGEIMIII